MTAPSGEGERPGVRAYIALGANLGDPRATLGWARRELGRLGTVTGRSGLYWTAPVGGPPGQPDYLNAVVALDTSLGAEVLLAALHDLEAQAGRERRERWEARVLDLDLLLYGDRVQDTEALSLPHPRAWERSFVLAPLCELAPRLSHPWTGETVSEALRRVGQEGVRRAAALPGEAADW